ncbi:Uncharacterised protein [Vibrio cholerae]|uniref:Uncharacterized protein n=1 Tax=Vibrio cholerae TaxID=666 RepID=A0A655WTV8_VIBCL|nr:Uncharacterised protein [Vibrio cholerae]CSB97688.1 Uncharacterised protein [Vibrio cholerae]CSI50697.1 Uncharacterised protein [Vibrio cholerae]
MYRKLSSTVSSMIRESFLTRNRTDVHDRTVVAIFHIGQHGVHTIEQTQHIHIKHALPFIRFLSINLPKQHDTGIVHQQIRRAIQRFGFRNRSH